MSCPQTESRIQEGIGNVVVKRDGRFVLQQVSGEYLLVPIGSQVMDTNGLVTLNDTGAFLWRLPLEELSVGELAAALAREFDVDISTASADVQTFLDEITGMGLM